MRVECASKKFLRNFSHGIFKDAGEGLILRRKASMYEHGRTPDLYKIKVDLFSFSFFLFFIIFFPFLSFLLFFYERTWKNSRSIQIKIVFVGSFFLFSFPPLSFPLHLVTTAYVFYPFLLTSTLNISGFSR
jgi:hypothetical protein